MFRIAAKALACAVAGFIAWAVTSPLFPGTPTDPRWAAIEGVYILLTCLLVSLAAGLFQGFQQGGRTNILLMTLLSVFLGTILGMFTYRLGGGVALALFGPNWALATGLNPSTIVARTLVGCIWGLGLGLGVGAGLRSVRGAISGLVGGLVGGGLAGSVFDLIGWIIGPTILSAQQGNEVGGVSRAILATLVGFGVGLFTALFEQWSRQAWVRLVLGRNEGKEWPLDAAQTTIGRDERALIPLFVDPQLPPLAAVIVKQGGQFWLQDPGSPIGVGLNGTRVSNAPLTPGDMIQVGSLQLQFLMKAGAAQKMMEGRARGIPVSGFAGPTGGAAAPGPMMTGAYPGPSAGAGPTMGIPGGGAPTSAYPGAGAPTQMIPGNMAPTQAIPGGIAPTQAVPGLGATQAVPQPSQGSLVAVSGPLAGQRTAVAGPTEFGRDGAQVKLPFDAQASRRHAVVLPGPGGLTIQDLGSTNGTFVNGAKVTQQALRPGDVVRIGSTEFRVEA